MDQSGLTVAQSSHASLLVCLRNVDVPCD